LIYWKVAINFYSPSHPYIHWFVQDILKHYKYPSQELYKKILLPNAAPECGEGLDPSEEDGGLAGHHREDSFILYI
jgi:hypothetical protein